ncbi:MAG: protein kinase, partial [Planctomycetes bacterium]|nr:protein kinase [Planctomycetota bacterium]
MSQAESRFGPWRPLREIGRGGMGVVHEVEHQETGVRRALKELGPGGRDALVRRQRFRREIEAVARLDHPNLIALHDLGGDDERPGYVMELVDGPSLQDLIFDRRRGRDERVGAAVGRIVAREELRETPATTHGLTPLDRGLCLMVAEVAEALQVAHDAGLIHRDVKPSNLLLTPDGRLKIGDFGLVRELGRETLTRSGELLGTPLYMSPEQLQREPADLDGRSDVYGLAASLYEALTLKLPLDRPDLVSLARALEQDDVLVPSRLRPELAEPVDRVLRRGLEKRPRDRYDSARAFAVDLRRLASGRKPLTARRSLRSRLRVAALQEPYKVGLAALLALVIVAQTLAVLRQSRSRQREARSVMQDADRFLADGDLELAAGVQAKAPVLDLPEVWLRDFDQRLLVAIDRVLESPHRGHEPGRVLQLIELRERIEDRSVDRPSILIQHLEVAAQRFEFDRAVRFAEALASVDPAHGADWREQARALSSERHRRAQALALDLQSTDQGRRRNALERLAQPEELVRLPRDHARRLVQRAMLEEDDEDLARLAARLPRAWKNHVVMEIDPHFPELRELARRFPSIKDVVLESLAGRATADDLDFLRAESQSSRPLGHRIRALRAARGVDGMIPVASQLSLERLPVPLEIAALATAADGRGLLDLAGFTVGINRLAALSTLLEFPPFPIERSVADSDPAFARLLADEDARIECRAVALLLEVTDSGADDQRAQPYVSRLESIASDPERSAAARAVAYIGLSHLEGETARTIQGAAVLPGLNDASPLVREAAAHAAGQVTGPDPDAKRALVAELLRLSDGDPEPAVRAAAIESLGRVLGGRSLPWILRLLEREEDLARADLLESLIGIESTPRSQLVPLLGDVARDYLVTNELQTAVEAASRELPSLAACRVLAGIASDLVAT